MEQLLIWSCLSFYYQCFVLHSFNQEYYLLWVSHSFLLFVEVSYLTCWCELVAPPLVRKSLQGIHASLEFFLPPTNFTG